MEDGAPTKMVLPYHWVDHENSIVFYPPKKFLVSDCIRKWLAPDGDWRTYKATKTLLKTGTREECQVFWNAQDSSVTEDSDRTLSR